MSLLYLNYPGWITPEIIPGLPIRWYGMMYIVGFGLTYFLFRYQIKKGKLDFSEEDSSNFFFWIIIGLLLGARIIAALVYDTSGEFWRKPWLIFWPVRNGQFVGLQGMSYHGGLVGGILGGVLYCRKHRIRFLAITDILMAAIPLGYTFGRLGNFLNAELYGRVTTVPWGMVFPGAEQFPLKWDWVQKTAELLNIETSGLSLVNLPRHPSQIYEALFEGVLLWLFLWFIIRKSKKVHGALLAWYLIGYGSVRFVIEYFRQPDTGMDFPISLGQTPGVNYLLTSYGNFSTGQIFCFVMILSGIILHILLRTLLKSDLSQTGFRKEQSEKNRQKEVPKHKNMRKLKKKIK